MLAKNHYMIGYVYVGKNTCIRVTFWHVGVQAANAILNKEKMQWQGALEGLERRLHAADAIIQQQQARLVRPSSPAATLHMHLSVHAA